MSVLEAQPPQLPSELLTEAVQTRIARFKDLDLSDLEQLPLPRLSRLVKRLNISLATWALTTRELTEDDDHTACRGEYIRAGKSLASLILLNHLAVRQIYERTGRRYQVQLRVGEQPAGVPLWAFEKQPESQTIAVPAHLESGEIYPLTRLVHLDRPIDPDDVPSAAIYRGGPFIYLTTPLTADMPETMLAFPRLADAVSRDSFITVAEGVAEHRGFSFLGGVAIQETEL